MKIGIDHIASDERQEFNRRKVKLMRPFAEATKAVLIFRGVPDVEFKQERVGQGAIKFDAYKLRTLKSDGVTPMNRMAAFMRRSGMDELIQYKNILEGTMHVIGWRPYTPKEYEEALALAPRTLREQYKEVVITTPPGLIDDFVIASHLGKISEDEMLIEKMKMAIRSVENASPQKDEELFRQASLYGLLNKMKRGDIRPRPAE